MLWIILVLVYGICKGLREVLKKKAMQTSSTIEVLFVYTFISFLLVLTELPGAGGVPITTLALVAVKSLMVFIAWIASFTAVRHVSVGIYGILDQSRIIFATLLAVFVLGEKLELGQILGIVLVVSGMLMLKLLPSQNKKGSNEELRFVYVALIVISCLFNAVSGIMDKTLMSRGDITSGQLQFWYMLFMVLYYVIYILFGRPQIRWKKSFSNVYIWSLAVLFVIADRCLFVANSDPASQVKVMTVLKQISCVVTIIGGRIVFKEKGLWGKLACAAVVIAGIVCSVVL